MIKLALVITNKHRLLSVAAILDVFESVNRFQESDGQTAAFKIELVGPNANEGGSFASYVIKPFHETGTQDLIFIPAFICDDMNTAITENHLCIPWLRSQFEQGAKLASFCTGAFLLAATGLLNGKRATTHIDAATAFTAAFPEILVKSHAVITDDGGVYTSGGATSSFHLMLHIIQEFCGKEMALRIAKMFAIDMDRDQQAYFGTFTPFKNNSDALVNMARQKIEGAYQEGSTIEKLIHDIPASRRNVVRRFKQATGVTPIEYLQRTRIEAAKKLLELTGQSVLEVMLNSGYNDLKSFRQLFKKSAGVTPKEYRDKFNISRMDNGRIDKTIKRSDVQPI
jgi:transcriptional regulator GlxA family with amidase domain